MVSLDFVPAQARVFPSSEVTDPEFCGPTRRFSYDSGPRKEM